MVYGRAISCARTSSFVCVTAVEDAYLPSCIYSILVGLLLFLLLFLPSIYVSITVGRAFVQISRLLRFGVNLGGGGGRRGGRAISLRCGREVIWDFLLTISLCSTKHTNTYTYRIHGRWLIHVCFALGMKNLVRGWKNYARPICFPMLTGELSHDGGGTPAAYWARGLTVCKRSAQTSCFGAVLVAQRDWNGI